MTRIHLDEFLREVAHELGAGASATDSTLPIARATLSALATALPSADLRALRASLPEELATALIVRDSRDSFYTWIARNEEIAIEPATAHAECVLHALGRLLDGELLTRVRRDLPANVAAHLGGG